MDIINLKDATKNKLILNKKISKNSCGIKSWEIISSFNDQLSDAKEGVILIFQLRKNDGDLATHLEVLDYGLLLLLLLLLSKSF